VKSRCDCECSSAVGMKIGTEGGGGGVFMSFLLSSKLLDFC
jgi:hypothetical protein